jgi:hypothetical protein
MTCDLRQKLGSMSTPIHRDLEVQVCASASNNVYYSIQERDCARPTMKPFKRPPDLGNGKLAEGATSQREATE